MAVIVAVVAVGVVEMISHQIIHVISVRDLIVTAVRAVNVLVIVLGGVFGRAVRRVLAVHRERVLLDGPVLALVVQVAVVQVVRVPVVINRRVLAARAVLVVVAGVYALGHISASSSRSLYIFLGVLQHAPQQRLDVSVGESVVDVLALPPAGDETLATQHPQALRDRGHPLAARGGYLRDTHLTAAEPLQ